MRGVFLCKGRKNMKKKMNNQIDLLHGPIMKSLIIFMIPIMLSNLFQQLYNAVDTAIVGNFLGEDALAAVGACGSVFELLVGFIMNLCAGMSLVISRCFGRGEEKLLKKSVAGAILIGLITCAALTGLSLIGLRPLLELINTPADIIDQSYAYISEIGKWLIVMFAYNLFAGVLRAIGNSVMPLIFLIISSVLNIVLDIVFITTFDMGVRGAAAATVVSQGVSAVLCMIYILKKATILIPKRKHFEPDKNLYKEIASQGLSMGIMGAIVSCGSIILQSGINGLGTDVIAGHTAARKLFSLFGTPFFSMAISVSTFVSQNKGADQKERIRSAVRSSYIYDWVMAGAVTVFLILTAPTLIRLISGSENPVIIENGTRYLWVVGPFYGVLGMLVQTRNALQAIGSKLIPLISSVIEFAGKILFVAILIPRFEYMAVIFCEPVIWCIMTVQLLYSFYTNPYIRGRNAGLESQDM